MLATILLRVLRFPVVVLVAWLVAMGALLGFGPSLHEVIKEQNSGGLPADAPSQVELDRMQAAFGEGEAKSYLTIVIENRAGLTAADDRTHAEIIAGLAGHPDEVVQYADYRADPVLRAGLVSQDGQASYIPVGMTAELGAAEAAGQVDLLREVIDAAETAPGTTVFLTGEMALNEDLVDDSTAAARTTAMISVCLLLLILTALYRRPVPVLVPLVTIGIAEGAVLGVLTFLGQHGLRLTSYSESFVTALVLGAGTDYSIFLVSRFREEYAATGDHRLAVERTLRALAVPLLASALTVALASSVMHFTSFPIFASTGPAMAVAVLVTFAASITVTPILLLWGGRRIGPKPEQRADARWRRAASVVVGRPVAVATVGILVLVGLSASLIGVPITFEQMATVTGDAPTKQGQAALDRHFPAYSTVPDFVLVRTDRSLDNAADRALLDEVTRAVAQVPDVAGVDPAFTLGADGSIARLAVRGSTSPFSLSGSDRFEAVQVAARDALEGTALDDAVVSASGAGGANTDLRDYFQRDFRFVFALVLLTVFLLLVLTLRSLVAPLFLMVSVVLSYGASVGVMVLIFVHIAGQELIFAGPLLALSLLVAVGADYNILLMSRMRETPRPLNRERVAEAVVATGPVITSAGIIFASTFVALVFSSVTSLAQTGLVLVAGLLLDTFVVRSLVVPAITALLEDRAWWPSRVGSP